MNLPPTILAFSGEAAANVATETSSPPNIRSALEKAQLPKPLSSADISPATAAEAINSPVKNHPALLVDFIRIVFSMCCYGHHSSLTSVISPLRAHSPK